MDGLVCGHELESLDGTVLVSRANQAAAFERIARSSRSWRTSRRRRRSSSRSSVVRPSIRSPASRAACFIQFRIAWADGSNWRANSSGVRPLRTSSMSRCRNSAGYGRWLFGIVDAPFRPNHGVSTKPGQLQLDGHGFSGLRLRTSRERDATRSPATMRGNCSTEDEPGYHQLLHSPSSPRRVYAYLPGSFQPGEVATKIAQAARARTTICSCRHSEHFPGVTWNP